ncbi:MAG: hypothetical protein EXS03_09795 [Phycisphaerales bacterium]|nr:hypothetical protein [Phycisphaerales bacterium]
MLTAIPLLITSLGSPLPLSAGPGAMSVAVAPLGARVGMVWLENADSGGMRLVFASTDGTVSSSKSVVTAGSEFFANWADTPQLAATADGSLVVTWLRRSGTEVYDYDIMASASSDAGQTWCAPAKVNDDAVPGEHGFVSLVPSAGTVRAFWLDGRAMASVGKHDGGHDGGHGHAGGDRGMQLRTSTLRVEGGRLSVAPSQLLDPRVCECCPTAAVATTSGFTTAYRGRAGIEEVRDIGLVRSSGLDQPLWDSPRVAFADGWRTSGCPVNGPAMDSSNDAIVLAWPTGAQDRPSLQCAFSPDGGATWGKAIAVEQEFAPGRLDVVMLPSGEAVVVWLGMRDGTAGGESEGVIRMQRVRADGGHGATVDVAPMGLSRRSGYPRAARLGDSLILVWTHAGDDGAGVTELRAMRVPIADIPIPGAVEGARRPL